ncbi:MAG TPA: tetratricopeptide repeat protein [Gemmataceae bacterium]
MATDPARSTPAPAARHLWQVPAFLAGVAAVIAAVAARAHFADSPGAAEAHLRDARKALDQSPPDPTAAVRLAGRVLAVADRYPQLAGEAHFVAGSAHLRLADEPAADAARERQQARQHLEQAERAGVPDADKPKLLYRLAKAGLLLGGDPAKAAALLEKSADADDPIEGHGLLALAYTRLSPPDLPKALEAAKQQLDRALRTNDAKVQAVARFRLGELHLQVKNVKDGRQMLSNVGPEAPPEKFYAARVLLAESYEETQEWAAAARNWEQARQDPKLAGAAKARVLYRLGRCLALEQRPNAAAVFEEAVALGGDEGQAAGLRLAELRLDADPAGAVAVLVAALAAVHGPDDYRNPLLPADDARPIVEKAVQIARDKGDWDLTRKAVEVYAKVAKPGKDDEVTGQTLDAQARAAAEKAKADTTDQAPALEEQARDLFRQAAAAYERAAGKSADPPQQGAWLWQSAQLSLKAGQPQRAQEALLRATQQDGALGPDQLAEAWLLIGNTYHRGQQYKDARAAYQKCLTPPGPYALRARIGLADIDLAEGKFDDAEAGLQDVLKAVRESSQPDAEVQEQAIYAAARLAFARQGGVKEELREYGTAEQRLLGAIAQYPDSPQAPTARRLLGLSYWTEARLKDMALHRGQPGETGYLSADERRSYEAKRQEYLRKSAEQYDKAEQTLLERQRRGRLSEAEAVSLKEVAFFGADCYWYLQRYEECIRRYGTLALRYQGRPEELIALSQVWQSYLYMRQTEKAVAVLKRIREAIDRIPSTAFDGTLPTHTRDYWEKWLKEASKPATADAR